MASELARAAVLLAIACNSGPSSKPREGAADPAAAINAAVPAARQGVVRFELRRATLPDLASTVELEVAVPATWSTRPGVPNQWVPPPGDAIGTTAFPPTGLAVGHGACLDDCAANSDAAFTMVRHANRVIADRRAPGRRTAVLAHGKVRIVIAAWWSEGARRYGTCSVQNLPEAAEDMVPAFEQACERARFVEPPR
jgi:hypothetical protein